ncbi:NAD-dependent succinate-semialdehyde dehydrogenase [Pseudactinotalea sp. Z1739]|uniref:NAD-dependent succinate-semialdehyde dehydrogenase n=1 Tax=Pseudactinotalea sp. Z1739 TaxID=3413028 RepID=UPI003C7D8276
MTTSPAYRTQNPATGEVLATYDFATDDQIAEALAASAQAFGEFAARPIEERAAIVARIGELFTERADELATTITTEMGKPIAESHEEVEFCRDIFAYYAAQGPGLAADRVLTEADGARAVIQRRALGPLLGIMPWNYPYYQVARFVAPNLMLGNTIILKHAEICPASALAVQRLFHDAGVPAGVYQNLFATHEQVSTIIADPRIQGISLTGSERAGAAVAEQAGRHLKKVVLELGGSDPYVVLSSSDPRAAAREALAVRMENTGQACNSNKRMIVLADVYEEFVDELRTQVAALTPADPATGAEGTYGPLSSPSAAALLLEQVRDAVDHGATLHVGGTHLDRPGNYVAPAVLTDIPAGARAYREELFGPVAAVYKVASEEEALRLANDSPYGLSGTVFATEPGRAEAFAEQMQVGMAGANAPAPETADMPFGGVKRSGYGRELGPLGMDEFVNKRLFYVESAQS